MVELLLVEFEVWKKLNDCIFMRNYVVEVSWVFYFRVGW